VLLELQEEVEKLPKKEGRVSRSKAKAKTPRSQKKTATVRKSRY